MADWELVSFFFQLKKLLLEAFFDLDLSVVPNY